MEGEHDPSQADVSRRSLSEGRMMQSIFQKDYVQLRDRIIDGQVSSNSGSGMRQVEMTPALRAQRLQVHNVFLHLIQPSPALNI